MCQQESLFFCPTDTSINYAQNSLHSQFPLCEGLEDTTQLALFLQFSVQSSNILYSGSMHRVCVSNTRTGEEKVDRGFLIGLLIVSIIFYSSFVNRQTKKKPTESGQEGSELK